MNLAQIFLTSGSTGVPKVVELSRAQLAHAAGRVVKHFDLTSHDNWLLCLPTSHVGGAMVLERARLTGASVLELGRWSPDRFVELATRVRCASVVPTQVFDLVATKKRAPREFRFLFVGGDRLSEALTLQARELGWPVVATYGMTETAGMIARIDPSGVLNPFSGVALSILDGKVVISEPGFRSGVFFTEDLAEFVGDDIRVLGRTGDLGKVLGEWVSLARLRSIWTDLDLEEGVRLPARIGFYSDPRKGLEVGVVLREPAPQRIEAFNSRVQGFERIVRVEYRQVREKGLIEISPPAL